MRQSAELVTILGFLLGLAACDGTTESGEQLLALCDRTVSLSVDRQTPPVFSWSPACRVAVLSVSGPGRLWAVLAADNSLVGPLRYGDTRAGVMTLGFADPLELSVTYTVVLERVLPPLTFDTVTALSFTP